MKDRLIAGGLAGLAAGVTQNLYGAFVKGRKPPFYIH